jgi:hypothetical protein
MSNIKYYKRNILSVKAKLKEKGKEKERRERKEKAKEKGEIRQDENY